MFLLKVKREKFFFLTASAAWGLLLCALALQPRSVVAIFLNKPYWSTVAHVAGHLVLAFSLAMALQLSAKKSFQAVWTFGIILSICIFSAIFTEAIQTFVPERQPSWSDFKYDMKGSFLGILAYYGFSLSKKIILGTAAELPLRLSFFLQNTFLPRRPAQAALVLSSTVLFLGLDSIQFLTVYCLAGCF